MIRVVLPHHLRNLAHVSAEVSLEVAGAVSIDAILEALESQYPMLKGTIRDHTTKIRRPFLRFFACGEDLSLDPTDTPPSPMQLQPAQNHSSSSAQSPGGSSSPYLAHLVNGIAERRT